MKLIAPTTLSMHMKKNHSQSQQLRHPRSGASFLDAAPVTLLLWAVLGSLASLVSLNAAELKQARVSQVINDVKLLPSQAAPRPATARASKEFA